MIEGRDYLEMEGGERRLPVAANVGALPGRVDLPLPVTCWVKNTGMYIMREQGEWELLKRLEL